MNLSLLIKRANFSYGLKESLFSKLYWILYDSFIGRALTLNPIKETDKFMAYRRDLTKNAEDSQLRIFGHKDITYLLNVTEDEIQEVNRTFLNSTGYEGHVAIQSNMIPFNVRDILFKEKKPSYITFNPAVSLNHPVIKRIITDKGLRQLVDGYLGFKSQLYTVNTMLTFPSDKPSCVTHWHRDYDDINHLTVFIYWTDVWSNSGATSYVPQSHMYNHITPSNNTIHLEGKAGSSFVVDTYGLHSGNKRIEDYRLVTWIRFGKIPNRTFITNKEYLFKKEMRELSDAI